MKKFWTISLIIYLGFTGLFTLSLLKLIPLLRQKELGKPSPYFIVAGLVLSLLLLLTIVIFLSSKSKKNFNSYLLFFRIKPLDKKDVVAIFTGLTIIIITNGLLFGIEKLLNQIGYCVSFYKMPNFTGFNYIQKGNFNILYVYFPYLFFNIFGEEILWRGYLLPLQEKYYPKIAWLINSAFWLLFHIAFIQSIVQMLPLIIGLPYFVSKRQNTSVGFVIHTVMGLIGFFSILANLF